MQRTVAVKYLVLACVVFIVLIAVIVTILLVVVKKPTENSSNPGATPSSTPVCYFNFQSLPWTNYRLSNTTVPTVYVLTIQPFIQAGTFNGTVAIRLNVSETSCFVYLHQNTLNITNSAIQDSSGNNLPLLQAFPYPQNQYWVLTLKNQMAPGSYVLNLSFEGSLTQNIVGFYRSVYTNKITGLQSQLATTKFEPTYARKAFPCFDEPNKKANFSVIIISDPGHNILLSNMPVESWTIRQDAWTITRFQTSVKMSTYLVCFVISDFANLEMNSTNGVRIRTYAPNDRIGQTKFALEIGVKVLDFYDQYFGIPYNKSISKLDLVSIPDFVSGAMENWGIVTFRETNILFNPAVGSASAQERVAEVVCHELAHMWFGNLVTMNWWDDLWLNEGFATFMAYVKAQPSFIPQWNTDSRFVIYELQDVLILDSAVSSHPIIQPVYHPDDINAAFDSITYGKGSSVLRMLEAYLGPDSFQRGIQTYLHKFQYRNAKTDDLWNVLQQVSGQNVKQVMDRWTKQMGFPAVTWHSVNGTISQNRFFSNPNDARNSSSANLRWFIPLTYQTEAGTKNSTIFDPQNTQSLLLPPTSIGKWIKFNRFQKGYIRVNYDSQTWTALTTQLKRNPQVFNVSDRAELVDDAFNLAGAGQLAYDVPLSLLQYLEREDQWVPWDSARNNLLYIDNMLRVSNQTYYSKFSKYILKFSSPVLSNLGWKDGNDDNNRKQARALVISLACGHGDNLCVGNASRLFQTWLLNQTSWISLNYRRSVYKYGMQRLGNGDVWNTVWKRYLNATPENTRDFQYALAQASEPWLLQNYIKLAENSSYVRDQDYFIVLRYISENPVGTLLVYNYVKTNWNQMVARFTLNDRYFGRLIPSITANFNTQQQLNDVWMGLLKDFFAKYPKAGAGAGPRKEAIADIEKNIEWTRINVPKISKWLQKNVQ